MTETMAGNGESTEIHDLHGIEVAVTRKGAGPPLLLLHGGGGPVTGLPFADRLAENFEIIAPTHPGFAGGKIPEPYDDIHDLAFTYLDLMDKIELSDAVVMGISLGGWLAAELAVMTTARMSKLILVDSVGVKHGGPTDRDIADVFGLSAPDLAAIMWHDASKAPNPAEMTDEQTQIVAANRTALALYSWEPYMHNPKLAGRLHRIDRPTLFLWGASDGVVTPDYGRKFAALVPGAKFTTIAEAGHAPHAEQPDAFVAEVLAFTA